MILQVRKYLFFARDKATAKSPMIYLLDHRYCIEVTPHSNKGNEIFVLKNDQLVDTTPRLNNFNEVHRTCFDLSLPSHDIIELRNGGIDGVRISLDLVYNGSSTQLLFGQNADLTSVVIDGNNNECSEQKEITPAIKIHDGRILKSECIGSFTYMIFDHIYLLIPDLNSIDQDGILSVMDHDSLV